ncbi:oxygenase MpaB family protein [Ferrovum sp. PN-J185]|uniref:oxygenase MpaB family protein n=1 Tax=Ferrovum sp. PN-J185 TaxID=1356306 RepID=UPI0007948A88|nr:oxygenase MpaB family protein [Ferrovum sp. PN-J185]KXW55340.1 hypothetical protein FV185_15860 [Ferrovum sp. PN-J185]MCC6068494.1 oxygenase MpaB family protein [Ferrovum sp. PN-J185]MDE1892530.1 DUF2236 domain-containing protein [Betaproteobacteria bacterium]MDE2056877.1 DUF2236 domain-containing protein [Betaproteobacteria bacterium]
MWDEIIRQSIRRTVKSSTTVQDYLIPPGDPGLFGPNSVIWQVHADFISMMIGGISSLIMQALHPQAMAGVWDHSTFKENLPGRLGRTAQFIAATTYGSTEMALSAIERVKRIHDKVTGIDDQGISYQANDPHLLKWVHITESFCFLNSHLRYRDPQMSISKQNQYFLEIAQIGHLLGGTDLPVTLSSTIETINIYRQELRMTKRVETVIDLLHHFPTHLLGKPLLSLIVKAGFYNLPNWVYPLIGIMPPTLIQKKLLDATILAIAKPVRYALRNGIAAHSYQRLGMTAPWLKINIPYSYK